MPAAADTRVAFRGVEKRYAATGRPAVSCLDLTIERGEFLTLSGPSGSGKTPTLMLLAGFEAPSSGELLLKDQSLAGRPPYQRRRASGRATGPGRWCKYVSLERGRVSINNTETPKTSTT